MSAAPLLLIQWAATLQQHHKTPAASRLSVQPPNKQREWCISWCIKPKQLAEDAMKKKKKTTELSECGWMTSFPLRPIIMIAVSINAGFNEEYGWIKEYWPDATLVGEQFQSPSPWLILTEPIFMFEAEWHLGGSQWKRPKEHSPWSTFT